MSATKVSIEVERRADEVFAFATDPTKFAEWQNGVVSALMESNGTPAIGDHCRMTRRIGGAERPSTSELVPSLPHHRRRLRRPRHREVARSAHRPSHS